MLITEFRLDAGVLAAALLSVIWAVEHFFFQASLFDSAPITRHPRSFQTCRLAINLLAAVALLTLLPWPLLPGLLLVDQLLSLALVSHHSYFLTPLRPAHAISNLPEGLKALPFAVRMVPLKLWITTVVALLIKGGLLILMARDPDSAIHRLQALGLLALASWTLVLLLLQFSSFRLSSGKHSTVIRLIYAYGYLISWLADAVMAPNARICEVERHAGCERERNRLRPDGIPGSKPRHVVFLQIESLDWNVLHGTIGGRPITPFLNQLASCSQVYKIQAYHDLGTADMDYAVLSNQVPSKRVLNYSIPDNPYEDSLPRFMRTNGYTSCVMHGGTGHYYKRRSNFLRMGWDEIFFREEFKALNAPESYWGTRDQALLELSAQKLRQAPSPCFHFLITLDSHGPFNLIEEAEKTFYPGSRNWRENYFNSMALLDRLLESYVSQVPEDTLLVIYGDHTSGVHYEGFTPAQDGNVEYVPCIVHNVFRSNNSTSATHQQSAAGAVDLNILDIVDCLRRKIAASNV